MCQQRSWMCFGLRNKSVTADKWAEQVGALNALRQVNATSACTAIMARVLWHLTFVLCFTCHAAICGDPLLINNSLDSSFKWFEANLKPETFCTTKDEVSFPSWFVLSSHHSVLYPPLTKFTKGESRLQFVLILCSQNGQTLVVQLEERCILEPFTTPGPNVTATQPNTNTTTGNVTSPPLNTTATTTAAADTAATTLTTVSVSPTTTESGLFVSNTPKITASSLLHHYGICFNFPLTAADRQANALLELARDVSNLNSSQVDRLVSQLENLLSGPNVSLALGNTSINIVSNLLGASPEILSDSSNRLQIHVYDMFWLLPNKIR